MKCVNGKLKSLKYKTKLVSDISMPKELTFPSLIRRGIRSSKEKSLVLI